MKGAVPMTEGQREANRSMYAAMYLLSFLVVPSGSLLAAGSVGPALGLQWREEASSSPYQN
jgi:hypothetical protein